MFQCGECSMVFTTAGSVRRHMAVHQEERPFMCPYCQKTFETNVNCKKHMKTHRGEVVQGAQLQLPQVVLQPGSTAPPQYKVVSAPAQVRAQLPAQVGAQQLAPAMAPALGGP